MSQQPTMADFAKDFAQKAHEGQFRKDGRPYFTHPERVASLVLKYKGWSHEAESLIAAAYCHDLLEDTIVTYYDLVNAFGYCVASLVLELTTNPEMKRGIGSKKEYLGYKLKHMTHWALVIKLCDRLDNISDMAGGSESWKKKYIDETEYIISYIEQNREITRTHREIIEAIKKVVIEKKVELGIS